MLSQELEQWQPIKNFEGLYEISNTGRVRSLDRYVNGYGGKKLKRGIECKQFLRNGYLSVGLSRDGKVKNLFVHILVASHFVHNPENKPTVNHKKGNKLLNHSDELEWSTHSEQIVHAIKHGLYTPTPPTKKGDRLSDTTKKKMSESRIRYNQNKQS